MSNVAPSPCTVKIQSVSGSLGFAFSRIGILLYMMILIAIPLFGQEAAFHWSGSECSIGEFSSTTSIQRDFGMSSANRCFFTSVEGYSNIVGDTSESIALGFLNSDNTSGGRVLDSYNSYDTEPHFIDIYHDFAMFGEGVAFTVLTGNLFQWHHFHPTANQDNLSPPLQLPATTVSIIGKAQVNETHCLVLFYLHNSAMAYAAYLDADAQPQWSFAFDMAALSDQSGSFNDLVMLDETHFALGMTASNGTYELFTFNSVGEVTNSMQFQAGSNSHLTKTKIPGRLLLTTKIGTDEYCLKIENNSAVGMCVLPISNNGIIMPAQGDSTGFYMVWAMPGQWLQLIKYSWGGALQWSDLLAGDKIINTYPNWFLISPTNSLILGWRKLFWASAGGPEHGYHYWENSYCVAKILPDGTTTSVQENNIPLSADKVCAYPNPFQNTVALAFELSQAQPVSLTIYNIKGQLIKTQTGLSGKSGLNTLSWDGKDATDKNCPTGIYLLRVTASKQSYATKLIKVK